MMNIDTNSLLSPKPRQGFWRRLHDLLRQFSPSERLALYSLSVVLALSSFILLAEANGVMSTRIPAEGGMLVEGGVGVPRFINPLLATTQADLDLTALAYSGLLRLGDEGGYIPDLAQSYEITDGTTYTFHLRDGLTFHDGSPLTSADILFTIALAQNPDIKSPRRPDWEGVSITAPDERTVVFTLPHAYAPFLENATLGILPKHLWERVAPEEFPFHALNTHPTGSGPYVVRDVMLDATGAPTEYALKAFPGFTLGKPHISEITYHAYRDEASLLAAAGAGTIESFVASSPKVVPSEIQARGQFIRAPLTRIFGIFLNQNHAPILADVSARRALDAAIDKESLVEGILGGFGSPLAGPVPESILSGAVAGAASSSTASTSVATSTTETDRITVARQILVNGGWNLAAAASTSDEKSWKKGESSLSLTLATADTEELVQTANAVAEAWRAAGIPTDVRIYPLQEFNQNILRTRQYDAILFGEAVGRSLDLFPFWHSSQRNDPGLNLSLYTNAEADRALAEARAATNREEREALIRDFLLTVDKDDPAVFLYSPEIAYLVPSYLHGVRVGPVSNAAERFAGIHSWYRDTERVWDIFTQ